MRNRIAHYDILQSLGRGGMGEVYRARDGRLGRDVALKVLPPDVAADPERRARLEREARAVAALNHPNLVTIHSIEEADGVRFLTMELVEGETLAALVVDGGMPLDAFLDVAVPLADALAAAHAKGITHRDLKPANVMRDTAGRVKVLDFGLAKVAAPESAGDETIAAGDASSGVTAEGRIVGTVAYMSPEQAEGRAVDARSDVFSLGILLYELLTGRRPFAGGTSVAILSSILKDAPDPVAASRPDLPPELGVIVARCLEKAPARRFASAREVKDALDAIARGGGSPSGVAAASHSAGRTPSVAVMPFANLSADPENEFFSDGLAEELLGVLARNPNLKVTGRTSSFAFKGKNEDLRSIGRQLGVENILEGSVRKAGSRVRIRVQLVNAGDGFHVWSETYDRVLEDIFAVQDDIARAVATALEVALRGGASAPRVANAEGFTLALRAKQVAGQWTDSSVALAIDLYRRALDIDEGDARAWAGIARAFIQQAAYGFADLPEATRRAREAADKAIALDDRLPEAHEAVGHLRFAFDHDFPAAMKSFRRAYELAPSNAQMVSSLAGANVAMGRLDEGLALARRAVELDPLSAEAHVNLGRNSFWAGRVDDALASLERALELSPSMTGAWAMMAMLRCERGDTAEALAVLEREATGGYAATARAIIHAVRGERDASDRALAELVRSGSHWAFQIAIAHAMRGEKDEAFAWLETARAEGDAGIPWTKVQPMLRGLHDDSRWAPLLERIGF